MSTTAIAVSVSAVAAAIVWVTRVIQLARRYGDEIRWIYKCLFAIRPECCCPVVIPVPVPVPPPQPPPQPPTSPPAAAHRISPALHTRRIGSPRIRIATTPPHSARGPIMEMEQPHRDGLLNLLKTTEPFASTTFETDNRGRILSATTEFEELVGLSLSEMEVSGYGWTARLHPEDFAATVCEWLNCFASGREFVGKFRIVHAYDTFFCFCVTESSTARVWTVDDTVYDRLPK